MEVEGDSDAVTLPGDGRDLVAFLSFAAMRGFGAQHPLIALADRLHAGHGVRMGPLTTFYDRTVEDLEDAEKIELAWQPAGPLRASLAALVAGLETDQLARTLAERAHSPGIGAQAAALLAPLDRAHADGRRVRLVYEL